MNDVEEFLEHHGIKGQRWGVRRASKLELKTVKNTNRLGEKKARNDPTFKREVKATRKNMGISGATSAELTKNGKVFTGRILGNFTNSKGEKVSTDFANSVLSEASKKEDFKRLAGIGALFVATVLVPVVVKKKF